MCVLLPLTVFLIQSKVMWMASLNCLVWFSCDEVNYKVPSFVFHWLSDGSGWELAKAMLQPRHDKNFFIWPSKDCKSTLLPLRIVTFSSNMKHFLNISNKLCKNGISTLLLSFMPLLCHLPSVLMEQKTRFLISWVSDENVYSSECPYVDRVDNLKSQQG